MKLHINALWTSRKNSMLHSGRMHSSNMKVCINGHRYRSATHLSSSMYLANVHKITLLQHRLYSNTKCQCLKLLHPANNKSYTIPTLAVSLKDIKFLLCKSLYFLNCNHHVIVNVQTRIPAHSELGIPFQNKNSDVYYMTRSGD